MSLPRSDENPNDITGGAGCLCHPRGSDETRGPFIIFTPTTTDDNLSPHAVLCTHCAHVAIDVPEEVIDAEVVEDDTLMELPEKLKVIPI